MQNTIFDSEGHVAAAWDDPENWKEWQAIRKSGIGPLPLALHTWSPTVRGADGTPRRMISRWSRQKLLRLHDQLGAEVLAEIIDGVAYDTFATGRVNNPLGLIVYRGLSSIESSHGDATM